MTACENCKVMKLVEDFSRRMQKGDFPDEALDGAIASMNLSEREERFGSDAPFKKRAKACVITCSQPGCKKAIHYSSDDCEVPLYCETHRTKTGRHAETRRLNFTTRSNLQ